jgi:hypothetical protein
MAKTDLKVATIKTANTVSTLVKGINRVNNKIIYGKSQVPPIINFSNPIERNKFTSNIKSFTQDPSLVNATFIIQNLNSFDLCNPFMFAISQAFPPGSSVANTFTGIQSRINKIVSLFENYSLTDGVKQAQASARDSISNVSDAELAFEVGNLIRIPFQTGKIFLNIKTTDTLANGASITITQLDDNKVNSSMIGQIERVTPGANGSQNVSINVNNIFPSQPPVEQDGETLRTFSSFNVEYETKTSSDIRQLSEDLQDITNELRSIGILDIISELDTLPDFIPGVSKLKQAFSAISSLAEQSTEVAGVTGTIGDGLAGNIPASEVILRVRIIRDFYNKIRPYTNLNFAIQSFFEDEIEGINRFLRNAIPYEAIASLVGFIVNIARTIVGIINYVIGLLKVISTTIKVITVVLKVLKVIIKVLKLVIKAIPSITTTVGVQEKAINGVASVEETIQQIIDLLSIIQWGVDSTLKQLQLTKQYLQEFIKEGAKLQATLESCPGLNGSNLDTIMNQANRNSFLALKTLLANVPILNTNTKFGNNGLSTNGNNTPGTFVVTEGGNILILTDTIFGFDELGNIVFYGDLISLSTGVNFENTLGQDFRSKLQYYTFNKFKNLDAAGNLIQKAEKLFLAQQTRVADPNDVFGNFQELYLGYTLKIQEEKRTNSNSQILVRRRGLALDSNEKIVASTELTFSTDLSSIVQELKIKLNQFVQQGIIGYNTLDSQPNEVSDEDAINLAESYGANPIGINNLKANNSDNSITNVIGAPLPNGGITGLRNNLAGVENDDQTVETRIGSEPFSSPSSNNINTTVQGIPVNTSNNNEMQVTGNNSPTINKKINLEKLITTPLNQFINENPSLKSLQDTFSTLSKISPTQLSAILSQPGAENLNEEELITKLKVEILTEMDPNPDKVKEVKDLTDGFLIALETVVRAEWEAATRITPIQFRIPFEEYYNQVEDDKIKEYIELLIKKGYTEAEIQLGLGREEISNKYSIRIDGTKVTVRLRSKK